MASAAGGIGVNAVNILGVGNSFLKSNANNYENINTPEGVKQESAIIKAHKKATGLNNPHVVNSTDLPGLPDRLKYGAYMPRHLVGLQGLGKDLNLPKNEGLLVAGPDAIPAAVGAGLFMQGQQGSPLNRLVNAASNTPIGLRVNPKTDVGRLAGRAISNEAQYAWNQIMKGKLPWMGR